MRSSAWIWHGAPPSGRSSGGVRRSISASAWIWLPFFVDTEHQRAVRRRQIEAYDVADLVHEVRIAGQLERLRAVRLQAEGAPDAPDRRVRKAAFLGHRAQRPMGGVRRRRAERPLDNLGHLIVRERSRPSRPRLIRQPLDALLQEAAAPLADRVLVHAESRLPPPCSSGRLRSAGSCGSDRRSSARPGGVEPDAQDTTVLHRSEPRPPSAGQYHAPSQ